MSSSIQQKSTEKKYTMSIAATLALLLSFASLTTSLGSTAFAQSNQTSPSPSPSPNQTGAQVTGQPETTVLNKTTIPAQQTNVTVNQTTQPVSPQALQPLENLTQSQTAANLSGIENKTMVTPTGNATTTLVNKTTVPFNQTMVSAGEANQTTGQQQQGQGLGQQASNATSSSQPSASAGGGGAANQTQQQEQANDTAPSQQSGAGGGGGGRVEQENQQNNTQGGGNDPLSQMGESIGNIFGQ